MKFVLIDSGGFPTAFFADDVHGARNRPIYGDPVMRPVFGPAPAPTDEDPAPEAPIIGEELDPTIAPNPPVLGEEPNPDSMIPVAAVEITEGQWQELISNQGTRRWQDGAIVPYDPPPLPPVLQPLTPRQMRLVMLNIGLTDADIEAQIAAIADPAERAAAEIEWRWATQYERSHWLVEHLRVAMAFGETEFDDLWLWGMGL